MLLGPFYVESEVQWGSFSSVSGLGGVRIQHPGLSDATACAWSHFLGCLSSTLF